MIRDVFLGRRRFDEIAGSLGVARNVLSSRLQRLVDEGILEKRPYSERPQRFEYFLTEMGLDLWPVLVALMGFGDRQLSDGSEPPMVILHKGCGGRLDDRRTCDRCGEPVGVREARASTGVELAAG